MAKKGQRILLQLQCTTCKSRNYITSRNQINTTVKLLMAKFCNTCRTNVEHKEVKA